MGKPTICRWFSKMACFPMVMLRGRDFKGPRITNLGQDAVNIPTWLPTLSFSTSGSLTSLGFFLRESSTPELEVPMRNQAIRTLIRGDYSPNAMEHKPTPPCKPNYRCESGISAACHLLPETSSWLPNIQAVNQRRGQMQIGCKVFKSDIIYNMYMWWFTSQLQIHAFGTKWVQYRNNRTQLSILQKNRRQLLRVDITWQSFGCTTVPKRMNSWPSKIMGKRQTNCLSWVFYL